MMKQCNNYYKIIVYEKVFFNIEYGKKTLKKVYFKKIATYNNIHKSILTKKSLEIFYKWSDTKYHITQVLQDEKDIIIENYNQKVKKYWQLVGV